MIALIGDKELNNNSVSIRDRRMKIDSGENMQYENEYARILRKNFESSVEVSF